MKWAILLLGFAALAVWAKTVCILLLIMSDLIYRKHKPISQ